MQLSNRDIVELVYFIHTSGYVDREKHDYVHELLFNLHVYLDETFGNWDKIEELVQKVRENGERK